MQRSGLPTQKLTGRKIVEQDDLASMVAAWKDAGEKIVFTNGCFDILHKGHIDYLSRAADLGTKLIIALNTDKSVRRQGKGPGRPVNDQNARAEILASLYFTDAIILFDELTPVELIRKFKPHVLVKGNDYEPKEIAGYDDVIVAGGEVITIPLTPGYSTTEIIKRLKGSEGG